MAATDVTAQVLNATPTTAIALASGGSVLALPAGTTAFAGQFTGDGSIAVTSSSAGASTLVLADQTRFALPSPGTAVVLTRTGGAWSVDYTKAILANKDIVLSGAVGATATITGGTTADYTGTIAGAGRLVLTSSNGSMARLTLGTAGPTLELAQGRSATTLTAVLDGGAWSEDVTTALVTGRNVSVTVPATAVLPAGTTAATGSLALAAGTSLTVTAAATAASTLSLAGGTRLVLGTPGQSATLTQASGVLTIDQTSALLANQPIVLAARTVITLPPGTTTYTGAITGAGALTIVAGSAGSALKLADGTSVQPTSLGQTVALSQVSGVWTTDVTAALAANQDLVLSGAATATLPAGVLSYTGQITGTGTLALRADAKSPSTLKLAGGTSFVLPAAGMTETGLLGPNGWTADVTLAILSGKPVNLTVPAVVNLPAGRVSSTSVVTGTATLTVNGNAGGPSVLNLSQSPALTVTLTAAAQSQTATLAGGAWSTDVTSALLANQDIVLAGTATAVLPAGQTSYRGRLTGQGKLVLATGSAGGSLKLADGTLFALPEAGQSGTVALSGNQLTFDVGASLAAGQAVVLSGPTVATLAAGTTHAGSITGLGTLVLTSAASGPSTLVLDDGTRLVLGDAGETVTAVKSASGWSLDVTAALVANKNVVLDDVPSFATLPNGGRYGPGVITYSGTMSGAGTLTLSGNSSSLKTADKTWVLPSQESVTATRADGTWTTDITGAFLANAQIVLDGVSVLDLPRGITKFTNSIAGTGTLLVRGSADGGSTVDIRGQAFALPNAGQAVNLVFTSAGWSVDYTPTVASGTDIYLGAPGFVDLAPGTTFAGHVFDSGMLTLRTGAAGGGSLVLADGKQLVLPEANETITYTRFNNQWTEDASVAVTSNQAFTLETSTVTKVPAGTTTIYPTGAGTLTLTNNTAGTSVVQIAGGPKLVIPPQQSLSTTAANGVWTTDFSGFIQRNQDIVLDGPASLTLDDNLMYSYTGKISGRGSITFTDLGAFETGLTLADGTLLDLARGNSVNQMTVLFDNGVMTSDFTQSLQNNDNIAVTIPAAIALPPGTTTYTGFIGNRLRNGQPASLLVRGAADGSTLLFNGVQLKIPANGGPLNLTLSPTNQIAVDLTSNVLANTPIALTGLASSLALPAGTTTYTGDITGAGTITLRTGASGGGTLVLVDGTRFVLPAANETMTIAKAGGAWTADVTAALLANQDIVLSGNAVAALPTGVSAYAGRLSGTGTLTIKAGSAGSTLRLADGTAHVLGASGQSESLIVSNGAIATDITQEVAAHQAAVLNGDAVLRLPAGALQSVPAITGTGKLTITAADAPGGSTIQFANGSSFVLPAAGQTVVATLTGGVWTTDVTAALLANQPITLTGRAIATLPAGATRYTGTISGTGSLTIAKTGGPGTLTLADGTVVWLGPSNPNATLTLDRGTVTVDIGSALQAGQDISLHGLTAAALPAGTLTYPGTLTGSGVIRLTAGSTASSLRLKDGTTVAVPANGTATLAWGQPGVPADVTAALAANANLVLHGPAVVTTTGGRLNFTGSIAGSGTVEVLNAGATSPTALTLGGSAFVVPAGGRIGAILAGGTWTQNATDLIAGGKPVTLSVPTIATLAPGTTTLSAGFSGSGSLTLTASEAGSSLRLPGGAIITLPNAGESVTATLNGNTVTSIDASAALMAGHDIALGTIPTVITLPAGTISYAGRFLGTGAVKLVAAAGGIGSTLRLADGTTYSLPAAGKTLTLNISPAGPVADVTAAILANQPVVLTGRSTASLPGGTTTYTGTVSGSGTLTLTSPAAAGSQLVLGSTKLTLPDPSSTMTATFSAGTWVADVTRMLLAGKRISLDVPATATLPAGNTRSTGSILQAGTLAVTSPSGGSTLTLPDGTALVLTATGSTATVSLNNGPTSVDVSAMLAARQPIVLTTHMSAMVSGGAVDLTGLVSGSGSLTVKATSATTLVLGPNDRVTIAAGGTGKVSRIGGDFAHDVTPAVQAGQPIVLNGVATLDLAVGTNRITGAVTGSGTLVVTSSAAGGGTLVMPDGTTFTFASAAQTQTLRQTGGAWTADVTQALLANQNVTLTAPSSAVLPGGMTRYNAALNPGSATLTLTSSAQDAVLTLRNGRTIPLAGGEATLRAYGGGQMALDVSNVLAGGKPIVMNGLTVATLAQGTTTYTGSLSGVGTLTLLAPKTGSGTLVLPNGTAITVAANATQSVTLVDGVVANDVTAAIAGNQPIALGAPAVIQLAAGTVSSTTRISGDGTLVLRTGPSGGTLKLGDGTTFTLPVANETIAATRSGGVWTLDVSNAVAASQPVTLTGNTVSTLPAGTTIASGFAGDGTLTLIAAANDARIQLPDGTTHVLGTAGQQEVITIAAGKVASSDITTAMRAGQDITLAGVMTSALGSGTTHYAGTLSGSGTLVLTTGTTGAGTLVLSDGTRFVLGGANETVKAVLANGGWTTDYTAALAGNFAVVLAMPSTATLSAGTTTLTHPITGAGTLRLTSSATGGSTLVLADGTRFVLPNANETATATLRNGSWTLDVTAALLANKDIVLTGDVIASLPGNVTYTGTITGTGTLTLTSPPSGGAALSIGGTIIRLPNAGEAQTARLANGAWSVDVTAAILANQAVALTVPATVQLPAGDVPYTGSLTGNGSLTLVSATGGSAVTLNGVTYTLSGAGEVMTVTYTNGVPVTDVTAALKRNDVIVLNGASVGTIVAGITTYTGAISGSGSLAVTAAAAGAVLKLPNGGSVTLLDAGTTVTLTINGGVWVSDVSTALAAGKAVVLSGRSVAKLSAGPFVSTSAITGQGSLTLISANAPTGSTATLNGQTFILPAGNETYVASLANGVWSLDVTQAVLANQSITLNGPATVALPAGSTTYRGTLAGSGSLLLSSGPDGATLQIGAKRIVLAPSTTATATLVGGTWTIDQSASVLANKDVVLAGPTTVTLPAGLTTYAGALSGGGPLTLKGAPAGPSTLQLADGTTFTLAAAQTQVVTFSVGTATTDVSAALLGNQPLVLANRMVATLGTGTLTRTAPLTGTGTLTLSSGPAGGGTLVLAEGPRFTLTGPNQSVMATKLASGWTTDVTSLLAAGQPIVLSGAANATLPLGTTTLSAPITGTGALTLTASPRGASTLVLADGRTYTLPAANGTATLRLSGGVPTLDLSAAIATSQNIVLTGPAVVTLPAGVTTYRGTIGGAGALVLSAGSAAPSTLTLGGQTFQLAAGQTLTGILANGAWTTDATAAILANQNVTLTGATIVNLPAGSRTYTGTITGDGILTLVAPTAGTARLDGLPGPGYMLGNGLDRETIKVSSGRLAVDLGPAVAGNRAISLGGGTGSVMLAAGTTAYRGTITGSGTLSLFGSPDGASTLTLPGGQSFTVARNGVMAVTRTASGWVESDTVDITAAIKANQQSIVFANKTYVVDLPKGETSSYDGVMSGIGKLRIKGQGDLILNNMSTFTLPPDQITERLITVNTVNTVYHGIDLGRYTGSFTVLDGEDPPVVTVEKGATLHFGDPRGDRGFGGVANIAGAYGVGYNLNNVQVDGTLDVNYYDGHGYSYILGKISGTGALTNNKGSIFAGGASSFSGNAQLYSFNFGGSHGAGSMSNATLSNTFVMTFSAPPPSTNGGPGGTPSDGTLHVDQDIFEDHYGASVHNQGYGLLIFKGVYHYNDSGNRLTPSLSNPMLDYMELPGNASNRRFFNGGLRQFGDGTTAAFFMPGNERNVYFDVDGSTTGFNYNGTVWMNGNYGRPGDNGNVVIIGTPGNHMIFTQPTYYNGITKIEQNAILQLGDGTLGNGGTITTQAAGGPVTGFYSTSGGNGSIQTAESITGAPTDEIVLNGELILANTVGARSGVGQESLSNISGIGNLTQMGNQTVTLWANITYTGTTSISNGILALSRYGDVATSSGVFLKNAAAVFDISQAGDSKVKAIQSVPGSTIALGSHDLTVLDAGTSRIAGSLVDGGLGGGLGGGLVMVGTGLLQLAGQQGYTGATRVDAGTLGLDAATLASRSVTVAAGARLAGNGTLAGQVVNDGVVRAEGGTLTIAGDITGTGAIVVGAGAVVTIAGATAQTITLEGDGVLRLADPKSFTGTLVGFGPANAIDLVGVVSPSLAFSEETDLLTIASNGKVLGQIKVDEAFSAGGFTLADDGRGGTLIKPSSEAQSVLFVNLSGDSYLGDAQAAISVNGVRLPGTYTITASHGARETQAIAIQGSFGDAPVTIDVAFLNDAYSGTPATDRNLYIDSVTYHGKTTPVNMTMKSAGTRSVTASVPATDYTIGAPDTLKVRVSEDAWRGDAMFRVSIDGKAVGDIQTVTALHGQGASQDFTFTGAFGPGPHAIGVTFLNDSYGGTPTTDRNVYVDQITFNGQTKVVNSVQLSGGLKTYSTIGSANVVRLADPDAALTAAGNDTVHAGNGAATIRATGPAATVIGAAGHTTVIGGAGTLAVIANEAEMVVTAGTGAMTFIGGSGHSQVLAGRGGAIVTAGTGGLDYTAGSGNAVLTGGSGVDVFSFLKEASGGTALLKDFTPGVDAIRLVHYSAASITQSLSQAYVASGNLTVELSDHTRLQFAGLTSIDPSTFRSG